MCDIITILLWLGTANNPSTSWNTFQSKYCSNSLGKYFENQALAREECKKDPECGGYFDSCNAGSHFELCGNPIMQEQSRCYLQNDNSVLSIKTGMQKSTSLVLLK